MAVIDSAEFWGLVGTVVTSIGGITIAAARWLGNHFAKIQEENRNLVLAMQTEKAQQRAEFMGALEKRDEVFTASLEKRDAEFSNTIEKVEERCSEQRALDRAQREEDRKTLLRIMGLQATGDTGKFTEPRPSRGGRTSLPERDAEAG